ncbi:uncharacterized protein LOC115319380 isoform X2 [Ixodes scapularis]|uniref:uncharacterized protein LOC115319380 isoform X2 n=1 Tax=Ixodes scapularis TaxID=6945 RepID=UPI001C392225|nr:uncharacterized protein LOC115319380 isoform X2 [Ixodes scapularis]
MQQWRRTACGSIFFVYGWLWSPGSPSPCVGASIPSLKDGSCARIEVGTSRLLPLSHAVALDVRSSSTSEPRRVVARRCQLSPNGKARARMLNFPTVTNNSRGWKQLARVHSTGCKPWTSKLLTTNLRPAVLTKRALMAIQQLLRGAVEGPECTCATSFARAIARGNRFHAISPVTCASQNEFDVGTDGMLWCRYCNYVSKRGFNMRRHYQRNHLGLLAPRLVSRAELVLLPPVSEGSHRGWILP